MPQDLAALRQDRARLRREAATLAEVQQANAEAGAANQAAITAALQAGHSTGDRYLDVALLFGDADHDVGCYQAFGRVLADQVGQLMMVVTTEVVGDGPLIEYLRQPSTARRDFMPPPSHVTTIEHFMVGRITGASLDWQLAAGQVVLPVNEYVVGRADAHEFQVQPVPWALPLAQLRWALFAGGREHQPTVAEALLLSFSIGLADSTITIIIGNAAVADWFSTDLFRPLTYLAICRQLQIPPVVNDVIRHVIQRRQQELREIQGTLTDRQSSGRQQADQAQARLAEIETELAALAMTGTDEDSPPPVAASQGS
ncbi:MAG: hypothetical protein AAB817_01305 [Patescibacteria group bacterium]